MINWNSKGMRTLKAHPRVADVEAEGLDEGRFFVHLKPQYCYCEPMYERDPSRTKSFSSVQSALIAVEMAFFIG